MSGEPTLVVDLDNTLVACAPYYDAAREDLLNYHVERTGLNRGRVHSVLESIEDIGKDAEDWSSRRLPTSFRLLSELLDQARGVEVDRSAREWSERRALRVFLEDYTPFPGVHETLLRIREAGWRLVLCTKGEPWVQHRKVVRAGLDEIFHAVHVLPNKLTQTWAELIDSGMLVPEHTVVVGDSWVDDIQATVRLGMRGVWVNEFAVVGEQLGLPCDPRVTPVRSFVEIEGALDLYQEQQGAWRGKDH